MNLHTKRERPKVSKPMISRICEYDAMEYIENRTSIVKCNENVMKRRWKSNERLRKKKISKARWGIWVSQETASQRTKRWNDEPLAKPNSLTANRRWYGRWGCWWCSRSAKKTDWWCNHKSKNEALKWKQQPRHPRKISMITRADEGHRICWTIQGTSSLESEV